MKKFVSLILALALLVLGSQALVSSAADTWTDVMFGDFEATGSMSGINIGTDPNWAVSVESSEMSITRCTDNPISGTASMKFASTSKLGWQAAVRKQFTGNGYRLVKGVEAITFQIYTETDGTLNLNFYRSRTTEQYICNVSVTGSDKVQTIIVPLVDFKLYGDETYNIVTHMGDALYTETQDMPLRMYYTTSEPAEILFDNFMQTKATGYQTAPVLNDDTSTTWEKDIVFGDFEATDSISGENGGTNPNWAPQLQEEGMSITRCTDNAISGTASMKFAGTSILDWHAMVRKQFTRLDANRFVKGVEAITFQIYTKTDGTITLSFYRSAQDKVYKYNVSVTGSDMVQTIIVPLEGFKLSSDETHNIVSDMGEALYTETQDMPLALNYTTSKPAEIIFDNFMQTKATGYKTAPVLNDNTDQGNTPSTTWEKDIVFGDFEATDSISGLNEGANPNWALQLQAEGMSITRCTDNAISGTASMKFAGTSILDWHAMVRKQFTGNGYRFVKGVEAITFQIYTKTDGTITLSFYRSAQDKVYKYNVPVTGSDKVQTIIVPLEGFKLSSDETHNIVSDMGEALYTETQDMPLALNYTTSKPAEILFDNFMQTKATGYKTAPVLNDNTDQGNTPSTTWEKDIMFGDFETSDAISGVNNYTELVWAPQVENNNGTIKLTTDPAKVIYGKQSVVFTSNSESSLTWETNMRRNFGAESERFRNGIGAITFQIRTKQSGNLSLSLWNPKTGANYVQTIQVTGSDEVQTIVAKLKDFILQNGAVDILTGEGSGLYTLSALTFKIDYRTTEATEIVMDTFMQTAETGYAKEMKNEYFTVTAEAEGEGTVSGGGKVLKDETTTLTAEPTDGYCFYGWYLDGEKVSASASYAVSVNSNVTYTAKFVRRGDVDVSGSLSSVDLTILRRALLDPTGIDESNSDIFDVNGDDEFDIRDLVALKKLIVFDT